MRIAKLLITLVTMLAVAAAAGAAWALPESAQTFAKGAPEVTTSGAGPLFSLGSMSPGHTASRMVTVRNTGEQAGRFQLSAAVTGSALLARSLRVTVSASDRVVFVGRLSALRDVRLVTLAPGSSATVRLRIEFVSTSGDDRLQGLAADASFIWSATQS